MAAIVHDTVCPGCGAPAELSANECEYCGRPVLITQFSSVRDWSGPDVSKYVKAYEGFLKEGMDPDVKLALAICLLKLGQHARALVQVSDAISYNVDNPEAYFYSAIARLGGKRPALGSMDVLRESLNDLESAKMLESRGAFYYLSGLIRADFFERKRIRQLPTSGEEFDVASSFGVSQEDIQFIHDLTKTPMT
ncbi:zinc ribbon domain-containing protein [Gordonia phthalatica]|uniref:Uncharacterized protein n=1 Tax=Gordonia phthalatica TaxID=1136941 RepID=A0A0N7FV79_9ACTN|nr:zinc ribbon domain-containing protein [Gordonia phthalatica]ALG86407.1 hypothetical protein ACH46_20305 [Gordonia phthalatica]